MLAFLHNVMPRRVSPFARALRSLTALITVWCLGCSAFEPLLERALRGAGGAGMRCESDESMATSSTAVAAPIDATSRLETIPSDGPAQRAFSCGCQSCQSVSVTQLAVIVVPVQRFEIPSAPPTALLSIEREPLVPPPQSTL
jgi:hypothetical protein